MRATGSTVRGRLDGSLFGNQAVRVLGIGAAALSLAGCLATTPSIGGGSATAVTGSAAGSSAAGSNDNLERCDKTLGVIRIEEDRSAQWYSYWVVNKRLGSTLPLLRMLVMQSNCFVIVERGAAERSISDETARARGEEARESATRGKGQQVVADYLLKPEIVVANKNAEGGNLGGLIRNVPLIGGIGYKSSEVGTVLTLVDIRSTVQLAAAEGYSKNTSFSLRGTTWGSAGVLGGSAYSNTDEGKLVSAAFFDAYNKMVVSLRNYKAQQVEGGMGEGGSLGVQGGSTKSSKQIK